LRSEPGGAAIAVLRYARFKVVGLSNIESVVRAAKDVHPVHADDDGIVCVASAMLRFLPGGWLAMSEGA